MQQLHYRTLLKCQASYLVTFWASDATLKYIKMWACHTQINSNNNS